MLQNQDRRYTEIGYNNLSASISATGSDISGTTSATCGSQTPIVVLTSTTGTTSQIVNVVTSPSKLTISVQ